MEGRKVEEARMEAAGDEKAAKQQLVVPRSGKNRVPGGRRRWRSSSVDMDVEMPAAIPTGAAAAMLSRSYSTTAAVSAAVVNVGGGGRQQAARVVVGEVGGREQKKLGAGARLSRKIKEQRARFYIFRRCVSMLICWHEDPDE